MDFVSFDDGMILALDAHFLEAVSCTARSTEIDYLQDAISHLPQEVAYNFFFICQYKTPLLGRVC